MNVFSDLPVTQQIDILTKWLSYRDVARLDSAICSDKHRTEFLSVLSSPSCHFGNDFKVTRSSVATWITKRSLKLRCVELFKHTLLNNSGRTALLECMGNYIKILNLMGNYEYISDVIVSIDNDRISCDEICFDIGRFCPNLTDICIEGVALDGTLSLLIHHSFHLRTVRLTSCTDIKNSILAACCLSKSLRGLRLEDCTNGDTVFFECSGRSLCTELHITSLLFDAIKLCNLCRCFPLVLYLELMLTSGDSLALIATHCGSVERGVFYLQAAPTGADMHKISTTWSKIKVLQIGCAVEFLPETALPILTHCLSLQYLRLHNQHTDDGWATCDYTTESVSNATDTYGLTELHTTALSKLELQRVVRYCTRVHTLCIEHTEQSLLQFGSAEVALYYMIDSGITHLTLRNVWNLSDNHMISLCHLESLKLCSLGTKQLLTNSTITTIVSQSPALHTLHIENCPGITSAVLLPTLKSCLTLRSVVYHAKTMSYDDEYTEPVRMLCEVVRELYPHLTRFKVSF